MINKSAWNTVGASRLRIVVPGLITVLVLGACDQATMTKVTNALNASMSAVTAPPVLTETFEAPASTNYTIYKKGQTFSTSTNVWTVEAGSIDVVNSEVRKETAAFDGKQDVDLAGSPGPGIIATSFATTAGQSYGLTFHYSRNNGIGATPARARVEVVGDAPLLQSEVRHAAPQPFNS